MTTKWGMVRVAVNAAGWRSLTALVVLALALANTGCRGCASPESAPVVTTAPAVEAPAVAPTAAQPEAAEAAPEAAAPVYDGPASENVAGYKLTTGFADAKGEPVPQPTALEATTMYLTVLDPDNRPLGSLAKVDDAEVHGFLVARDLRQAYHDRTSGSVAPGADARALTFTPREGGEHALIVAFRPESGPVQVVATPVVLRGNLPQFAGPGAANVGRRARRTRGDIALQVTPDQPTLGQDVTLRGEVLPLAGGPAAAFGLPWAVVCTASMGRCDFVEGTREGTIIWRPEVAGSYFVLLVEPPDPKAGAERVKTALTFGVTVLPSSTPPAGVK